MEEQKKINVPTKDLGITPLTHAEMHEATQERIYEISREFTQGFEFLSAYPRSVTFFGSTQFKEDHPYYIHARALAGRVAKELGYTVITGGGPGIMEAANRGAQEVGGKSIGLTIRLPREQVMNNYLTDHLDFYYFFSRKVCLTYSAEAFIFFPGGFGTLDEFFEIVTLLQTHKIPKIPVILVGTEYWSKLKDYMNEALISAGTIGQEEIDIFHIANSDDEVMELIKNAPVRESLPYNGLKVNPVE
jgi:uncharacterized protein (TIGR00730 family)